MKKTYIIPTLNVVKVKPMQLLTVNSIPEGDAYQTDDVVLSRRSRFSKWEDDFDFEEE